jgi:hypothetical protein
MPILMGMRNADSASLFFYTEAQRHREKLFNKELKRKEKARP